MKNSCRSHVIYGYITITEIYNVRICTYDMHYLDIYGVY